MNGLATVLLVAAACCPGTAFLFDVSSPAPDVYRVDVHPPSPTLDTRHATPTSLRSVTTALRLDAESGRIEIVRFDAPGDPIAWSGTISPIAAFGRANVPGIELSWAAKDGEAIYGAGERFESLNQAGRKVDFWIKDAPGQEGAATYYCTPVFYSTAGYGLFFTNNPEAFADFNSDGSGQHRYRRAGTSATFYVISRGPIKEQIRARAAIQGPYRGIPDWAWGPWISRNSYENQAEAEEAIRGMLDRNIPVSAIVQEAWKGTSETGEFNSFSTQRWPNLTAYLDLCRQHDIRNVLWQVPIVHPSHPGFADAVKSNYFVRRPDGSVSFRQEWLAGFANIDFTNPDAREYWKNQMRETVQLGIAGFKADDGEDIKPDDVFFDGRRGWEMHNEYSTLYNRTLTELLDEERTDGMLWSRSGSLGNETCPALWAGDQSATWDQLRSLVPAGLSASMSGMPFWGHDVGGYIGQPSPELYIRWVQFGAFSPLMQYHGIRRREPWEFGPEAERAYKLLARLRMELKPTLIALGREAAETGMPIMRPMSLEFPDDPRFASEDTQYMLGPDLLIAPVLEAATPSRVVSFPPGRWQHLNRPRVYEGPADRCVTVDMFDAPVFVRDGSPLMSLVYYGEQSLKTNPPPRESMSESQSLARALYLTAWSVAGPYPSEPRKAFSTVFAPETTNSEVAWQKVPVQHLVDHEGLDFQALLGEHHHAAAYARTTLTSELEQDAELRFGSDDTLTVWLNGERVYSVETYRSAEMDQDIVKVRLVAGENTLLVKVAQDVGAWRLMFRLVTPKN
jgi:alpha-D-xyloside xylohydrolase